MDKYLELVTLLRQKGINCTSEDARNAATALAMAGVDPNDSNIAAVLAIKHKQPALSDKDAVQYLANLQQQRAKGQSTSVDEIIDLFAARIATDSNAQAIATRAWHELLDKAERAFLSGDVDDSVKQRLGGFADGINRQFGKVEINKNPYLLDSDIIDADYILSQPSLPPVGGSNQSNFPSLPPLQPVEEKTNGNGKKALSGRGFGA